MEEGPRKLFKTISLVDRLKGSDYDTILPSPPVKDKSAEGEVIPKAQLQSSKKGVSLAGVPELNSKEPIILKTLIKSPSALIAPPNTFTTPSLELSNIQQAKNQFASTISLEDRLNQKDVTKTNHLPQYFLSDLYTGYLVITPFSTLSIEDTQELGSGLIKQPISVKAIEQKQDPETQVKTPVSEKNTLQSQGTFITNNVFESITQLKDPLSENATLNTQGTYISNSTANSFVETVDSVSTVQINQGSIELPVYEVAINQGVTLETVKPLGDIAIGALQGLSINNGQIAGSLQELSITGFEANKNNSIENPLTIHGSTALSIISYETDRALAFGSPAIKHGTSALALTGYETDRALAFGSPALKHGTAQLAVARYLENRTEAINTPILLHGDSIISPSKASKTIEEASRQSPAIDTLDYQPTDQPSPPDVGGIGVQTYNDGNPEGEGKLKSKLEASNSIGSSGDIRGGQGSLANYNSMAYGLLGLSPGAFEARYLGAANVDGGLGRANGSSPLESYKGNVKPNSTSEEDFIDLKFTPTTGAGIRFKAYLTSFSDGITANWNDVQYVGRIDTLKQYKGTSRAMSLSFLLPAFSKEDVDINMKKLEALISATVVGTFAGNANFVSSPLVKIKVGGLINSYCAVGSVKWDFDPAEATFDIDKQMPHMFKVSVDAAVLGTNDDKLLNGADGNYFGKSYA